MVIHRYLVALVAACTLTACSTGPDPNKLSILYRNRSVVEIRVGHYGAMILWTVPPGGTFVEKRLRPPVGTLVKRVVYKGGHSSSITCELTGSAGEFVTIELAEYPGETGYSLRCLEW